MSDERIYLSAPDIRHLEAEYVQDALESGWAAPAGPYLSRFESKLAETTGREYAVALTSGTAALHLALLELGVKKDDLVICSTLTFVGSANPITYCGAHPVFIDCEPVSWNMDANLLESELKRLVEQGKVPAAAIVVDLYGRCADYNRILEILKRYQIPMIEDAAEALGAFYNGRKAGSFGEAAILSFNGNKIITSSGGGALVTDSHILAERVRYLSTQARENCLHYEHTETGYNYRLSNISAALGLAQLQTLNERIARRTWIFQTYVSELAETGLIRFDSNHENKNSNNWLTCGIVDNVDIRDNLIRSLEAENIESRPVWKPMHLQPLFASAQSCLNGTSESLFNTGICLPSGSGMSDVDFERVVSCIKRVIHS